jgi:hypothetical protein
MFDWQAPFTGHPRPLSHPVPPLVWHPPSAVLCRPPFVVLSWSSRGSPTPCCPIVASVAAANVNPCTRLSHMIPFLGRDWCTRERCRLMMQNSQNSMWMTLRIFPQAQEFHRILDFARKSDEAQGSSTPPSPPWSLVRVPLKPAPEN